jgi:hypothetical protein
MAYRMIAVMLLSIALDLATATSARAQSVADADNAMHAMDLRMRALNTARKNLNQMAHRRDDHEADAVRDITDADVSVFGAAVKVFTVAFMITGMKCPDDVSFTQRQFGLVVNAFLTTADAELSRVNDNLHKIAAPTALAEATNIREAIVDLRDFLRPFAIEE